MPDVTAGSQYDLAGPMLHSMKLAMGGGGRTFVDTVTATPSGTQATTTALLNHAFTRVTVVGTAADGTLLPAAVGGQQRVVTNASATSLQIFATGTDTINGTAGATGIALAAGKTIMLFSYVGTWHGVLSA